MGLEYTLCTYIIYMFRSSILFMVYNILVFLFRGDSTVAQCGEVVGTFWEDNKVVRMLSTNCQPQESGTDTETS